MKQKWAVEALVFIEAKSPIEACVKFRQLMPYNQDFEILSAEEIITKGE